MNKRQNKEWIDPADEFIATQGHGLKPTDFTDVNIKLRQNQQQYHKNILQFPITFCIGPAGTSKTFTMCYTGLKLLEAKEIDRLMFVKPIVEAQEHLGFLPGDLKEKIYPHMESYIQNLITILQGKRNTLAHAEKRLANLTQRKYIKFSPLAYLRGQTLSNKIIFLDEAQNCTFGQLLLFITRLGPGSKMIIAGDITQQDIKKSGLSKMIDIVSQAKTKYIGITKFTEKDIVRHEAVKEIVKLCDGYN